MAAFRLSDGAIMPYADEGAGPVVVLLHGWSAHGGFFDSLRARLARDHRVITPTLRGHVGTQGGARQPSIEALGEDIAELARGLDLRGFVGLGWSMGAMALWAAAPQLGERLAGQVVEEMGPKLINDANWSGGLASDYGGEDVAGTLAEIEADWSGYARRCAGRMFAPETRTANPALVAWAEAEMERAAPAAMAALWRSMAGQDFRAALAALAAPVLAVRGAQSPVYPAETTQFVARAAPKGTHVAIPGAGHVPHLEQPDAFYRHVIDFVRGVAPTEPRGRK